MKEDYRGHLRLPVSSTVFIELISPGTGADEAGAVIKCTTLNVSRSGLHVRLEHELVPGTILQIGIELPDSRETLYLAGEVRWCMAAPGGGYSAGFVLLNADGSDIAEWNSILVEMED